MTLPWQSEGVIHSEDLLADCLLGCGVEIHDLTLVTIFIPLPFMYKCHLLALRCMLAALSGGSIEGGTGA